MYTYEKAIRAVGPVTAGSTGAMESAFRALEQRGAPDADWERLIDRIRGVAPPVSDAEYVRSRILALLG